MGHEVVHCSRLGWEKLANGRLLSAAEGAGFAVMIMVDQGIQHQQNLAGRKLTVIHLQVPKNDLPTLVPMAEIVLGRLGSLEPGAIITIQHFESS